MNVRHVIWASIVSTTISCQSVKKEYNSFDEYPVREDALTEMEYSPAETKFSLWAPTAEEVRVLLFESGNEGSASNTFPMEMGENGTWTISIKEDLKGKFYTFNVKVNGKWLGDTPGIMAKAVGVNGKRAAVLDLRSTDPEGWENDVRPPLKNYADIMVYEMHHRDFSLDSVSGIQNKGKFLALTEQGTISSSGEKTGIDHLKELGITHVHLLPSYDYASVDETKLDKAQYNWGMIRKITMCLTALILQILINPMFVSGNSNKWYKLYIRRESGWCLMWCIITLSIQTKAISNVRFPVISIARRRTDNGQMVRDVEMKRQATAP